MIARHSYGKFTAADADTGYWILDAGCWWMRSGNPDLSGIRIVAIGRLKYFKRPFGLIGDLIILDFVQRTPSEDFGLIAEGLG